MTRYLPHRHLQDAPPNEQLQSDFIGSCIPGNRHQRTETERFKPHTYKELTQRDKVNLDITWIKDESLEQLKNLPEPETLVAEIIENIEEALEQFKAIQETLEDE